MSARNIQLAGVVCLVMALAFFGCDFGIQRGQFAESANTWISIKPTLGGLDVISGGRPFERVGRSPQNLLYVLVLCPGVEPRSYASSSAAKKYTSTFTYRWETGAGPVSFGFTWDRKQDTVAIGDRQFGRKNGNVFVARRESDGSWSTQQLPNVGVTASAVDALEHIKRQLPRDTIVTGLDLTR